MKVRVEALNALASVRIVSEDILLQTLSKKASSAIKDKSYPGRYTAKVFDLPASSAAFAFVHGLEDEFYEVGIMYSAVYLIVSPCNPCILKAAATLQTFNLLIQTFIVFTYFSRIICESTLSCFLPYRANLLERMYNSNNIC